MKISTIQERNLFHQTALNFSQQPGRPPLSASKRRQARSITLNPDVLNQFISWADKKGLSFSRGAEQAILSRMRGSNNDSVL